MSDDKPDVFWRRIARDLDGFLLPLAFGVLSVLVLAQAVTTIPQIRSTVDKVEGRFAIYSSATTYSKQAESSATINLYVSPDTGTSSTPHLKVFVNGNKVATLINSTVKVPVHNGDEIEVTGTNLQQTVYVSVDHNNPAILKPAPGQSVELSPTHLRATFPSVRFLN